MWLRPPDPAEHWTVDEQAALIHEWFAALSDAGFARPDALYLVGRMLPVMRLDWPPGFEVSSRDEPPADDPGPPPPPT